MQSKKDKERMVAFLSHPAGRLYTNCLRQQFLSKQVATVPVEQACSDYFLFTKTSTHSAGQDRNLSVMHNFAMFSARNSLGMSQLPCTRQIWKATTPSSFPQRALFTHYFILPQNFSFSPDTTSTQIQHNLESIHLITCIQDKKIKIKKQQRTVKADTSLQYCTDIQMFSSQQLSKPGIISTYFINFIGS